jgi:hypothetical protein
MTKLDLIDLMIKLIRTPRSDELGRRRIIRAIDRIRQSGVDFSSPEMCKNYEALKNNPARFH